MMGESVTVMPTLVAARLVAAHVGNLWSQWANDEESPGCCTRCCASCAALEELLTRGMLDGLYWKYLESIGSDGTGDEVWDVKRGRVGRDWLLSAWGMERKCCEDGDES